MEYNPGIFPFFGLQNYKSYSNKKNYEQKSNNTWPFRRLPPFIRSLPEICGSGIVSGGIFDAKINFNRHERETPQSVCRHREIPHIPGAGDDSSKDRPAQPW
jgi:hypothetical protein